MIFVTIQEAQSSISHLIDLVLRGEEVCLARNNTPLIRLTKVDPSPTPTPNRRVGPLPTLLHHMDDSFNLPWEEWDDSIDPSMNPPT